MKKTRQTARPNTDADAPGLAARKAAVRLLGAVIDTRTSLDGLTDNEHGHPQYLALDMRDRGLVRAILASALRYRMTIEALIAARLDRPLPANARSLSHLLHVASAQILFLDVPDSAAVDLAVTQAKSDPRLQKFAGLVNAILREIGRRKERALPAALEKTVDAPDWLRERLAAAYGADKAAEIIRMQRLEAPIDLTVKSDPQGWAEKLDATALPTGSVRLGVFDGPLVELPGFAEGAWWVQDAAAALPARMFGDVKGRDVVDLCAAPGGKTAQLIMAGGKVTAVDASKNRLKRLAANLERLQLQAETVEADGAKWQPGRQFDAVLIDAPCSSTGTVRRHPDVPWTKGLADVEKLTGVQRNLLNAAADLTRPGGTIVFSNCSLDPIEGEEMVAAFLASRSDVAADPVKPGEIEGADAFINAAGQLRTTPADLALDTAYQSGLDGFFAARFRKLG